MRPVIAVGHLESVRLSSAALFCLILGSCVFTRRANPPPRAHEPWNDSLLELAREGFWAFDSNWRTTFVNQRMANWLGYRREELLGEDIRDFLVEERRLDTIRELLVRDPERPGEIEVRFRRCDGSKFWAAMTTQTYRSEDGRSVAMLATVEDVTVRKEAERERDEALAALQECEARYGRLVDSNIIGFITADLGGEVIEANDAFLRMVGYNRSDLELGKLRWPEMTPQEFHSLDRDAINELWARGACVPYEKQFLRKDGTQVAVLIGAAALERYPKTVIAFVLELTERKQVEHALKVAKDAAESASTAKDEFLAMLSHELRTPLTPVLLMATAMLEDAGTPDEIRPMLEVTRRNVELEAKLIDDLLDFTRISHGKLRIDRQVVDAHDLIKQALEVCRADIRAGNLLVRLDLQAEESHVDADPARTQQVFWNLFKNAVRFTPPGGRLEIRTRNWLSTEPGADGNSVIVEVSDTGIGIEPALLPRIFDAFAQGEASTRRGGGLGLGLAISRSIVAAHGWHLTAASEGRDRGATFCVEMGCVPAPVATAPIRTLHSQPARAPRALRILLVEDNRDTLRYLSWTLSQRRHTVSTADRIATARAIASAESFDILISDLDLPDGSGLELMRHLGGGALLPGIAMSGFSSDEDIAMSRAAGFSEHLTKPVSLIALEETIARVTSPVSSNDIHALTAG